jgi:CubicO group peptidase (beta-lactamase class C family)
MNRFLHSITVPALRKLATGLLFPVFLALAPAAVADQPHANTDAGARYWVNARGPGIVIAMARGDVDPTFVSEGTLAFGAAMPAADQDTLWRQYSMTKLITGLAAIALIEDGKLHLDDPISMYYPEYGQMNVLVLNNNNNKIQYVNGIPVTKPAINPITVRNLLTHTAGLGYSLPGSKDQLATLYLNRGLNPWQISQASEQFLKWTRPQSLDAFAKRLAKQPLLAEPGTKWAYSESYDLLAAVIEKAAGEPYGDYVQRRLLSPLGVTSTYWIVPASAGTHLSIMYGPSLLGNKLAVDGRLNSAWYQRPTFLYGGAGLVMSASDYDKVLRMLLNHGKVNGVQVLPAGRVAQAMSDLLPVGTDKRELSSGANSQNVLGFGAGGYVLLQPAAAECRGIGTFGWGGAAGTTFWIDPVHGVRVTAMINRLGDVSTLDAPLAKAVCADLNP